MSSSIVSGVVTICYVVSSCVPMTESYVSNSCVKTKKPSIVGSCGETIVFLEIVVESSIAYMDLILFFIK